ncbi:MAG: DnaJ family domain-containing protein [Solirubrobacterales bacterium]
MDRQVREAEKQGEFDDLPGAGKPLADPSRPQDENWWIKNKLRTRDSPTRPLRWR